MRIEVKYFADDETEFETEEECRAYEEATALNMGSVVWFDEDLNRMDSPGILDIESSAYGMYIIDEEKAVGLCNWLYEQISFQPPHIEMPKGAFLWYDVEIDEWVDVGKEASRWMDRLKKMGAQI